MCQLDGEENTAFDGADFVDATFVGTDVDAARDRSRECWSFFGSRPSGGPCIWEVAQLVVEANGIYYYIDAGEELDIERVIIWEYGVVATRTDFIPDGGGGWTNVSPR